MHSLSAESCDGESEDLMEAVKEGKRAATATNESGWDGGLGVCVCVDSPKQHEKQINTKKKKETPAESRRLPPEHVVEANANI